MSITAILATSKNAQVRRQLTMGSSATVVVILAAAKIQDIPENHPDQRLLRTATTLLDKDLGLLQSPVAHAERDKLIQHLKTRSDVPLELKRVCLRLCERTADEKHRLVLLADLLAFCSQNGIVLPWATFLESVLPSSELSKDADALVNNYLSVCGWSFFMSLIWLSPLTLIGTYLFNGLCADGHHQRKCAKIVDKQLQIFACFDWACRFCNCNP